MTSRLAYTTRSARSLFTTARHGIVYPTRFFQTASTQYRSGLKESSQHDPEYTEELKSDSLRKQKEGKGQWNAELASDSEEAVRADRDPTDPRTMQQRSKKKAEDTAKEGTNAIHK
ncbi:hypothetical protein SODALDRAFT_295760, partial [Sodiomyces alkalinus F11]